MEFEFDKEIDALLRQAARGGDVVSTDAHLDADEISAFAENALPEKTKFRYMEHLADCARCRKILSNLILLESETATETVPAFEGQEFVTQSTPWYRKIFRMPNLAYTMGALVLLFSGMIAFTVLQTVNNSRTGEVSQMSEKPQDSKSISSAPTVSNSANMAVNSNTTANIAPVYTANTAANTATNTTTANTPSVLDAPFPAPPTTGSTTTDKTVNEPKTPTNPVLRDEAPREAPKDLEKTESVAETEDLASRKQDKKEENKAANENRVRSDDADTAEKPAPKPNVAQPSLSASGASINTQKEKKTPSPAAKTGESTNVGGKTFRRSNNVWYDTNYNGQSTTNVTRGTAAYKKLDSDLRVIVENLGGTVVIVWKSKAYRIQ